MNCDIFDQTILPLKIKKGSHFVLPLYYVTDADVAIDLTDYLALLHVRRTPDADDEPDIILSTDNGGITIDEEDGIIYLIFSSASTLALDSDYLGTWDLFLIPPSSLAFCLLQGTIEIVPSTTEVS